MASKLQAVFSHSREEWVFLTSETKPRRLSVTRFPDTKQETNKEDSQERSLLEREVGFREEKEAGMVIQTCNSSALGAEAEGSQIQGQFRLSQEILSQTGVREMSQQNVLVTYTSSPKFEFQKPY